MIRLFVILLLAQCAVSAQIKELFSLPGEYKLAGLDVQGNSYLIINNALYKYDVNGKQLYNYSDNTKGNIKHINTLNPLKITVLFADYGSLVVLDNTLFPVGAQINLHQLGIHDPVAVCPADDNGFWIFDNSPGLFTLFTWSGQKIQRTVDVRRIFKSGFFPVHISISEGYIISYSENNDLIVMDNAGNIVKTHSAPEGIISVGVNGYSIYNNSKIKIIDLINLSESFFIVNDINIENYFLHFPYLLVQEKKKICLFLLLP